MKATKLIIIAAEIAAIICLGMSLYFCAQREEFDFCMAALCGMFAITAVVLQAINDEIAWDNSTDNQSLNEAMQQDQVEQYIDEQQLC